MSNENYVLNNKAAYSAAGIVAGKANDKLNEEYNNDTADRILKAISVQMRVQEVEVKMTHAKIKTDEHNRKYGANIKLRNLESVPFGE